MKQIEAIGVYCSSYDSVDDVYKKAARELGETLAEHHRTLIYGGSNQGLMGEVANATMAHGGRVLGFTPQHLQEFEEPNWAITEIHLVDTMHTRKRLMFEHSDAFIVLPGGFGTLDETFEIITWHQLELHEKPIVFININEYWTPLEELTKNIFQQHFAKKEHEKFFKFVKTIPEAFQILLKAPEPAAHGPVAEWV
jgi:uncharacterized protein (TIGR00730 family)